MIRSKTELRARQRELKSLLLRISRLRRKLMDAGIGRKAIENVLRPVKDQWGELNAEIRRYEGRS